jgi:hypothetical protein
VSATVQARRVAWSVPHSSWEPKAGRGHPNAAPEASRQALGTAVVL